MGGFLWKKKSASHLDFFFFFFTDSSRLIKKSITSLNFLLVSGPFPKYNSRGVGLALDHSFVGSMKEHSGLFFRQKRISKL